MSQSELPPAIPYNVVSSSVEECPICLEEFMDTLICYMPRCRHMFHQDCAYQWLETSGTCPMCRRPARAPRIHRRIESR